MKYATRIAAGLGCALVAGTTAFGAASASPLAAARPVATVNGIPIAQASLDAALAASGQCDSPALRRELKLRLIAREVLRQAAMRTQLAASASASASGEGGKALDASAEPAEYPAREAQRIAVYLRAAVHPTAVTDVEVHRRYSALARARAARSSAARVELPTFGAIAGSLRERLEAERFDEAVHRLAVQLTNEANIDP
ncbi:MAG TPA: hypothetical protein VGZ01_04835 [Trinickia sp.]|nr:hypothetical protein [Trinickia sp.]